MKDVRTEFLGLDFDVLTPEEACSHILVRARANDFAYVVTPNVDHVVRLRRGLAGPEKQAARAAYADAWLSLCDSRILSLIASFSGIKLPVVTGSDLTASLVRDAIPGGSKVSLIGGTKRQLDWLATHRPDVEWAQHIPPMGLRDNLAAQEDAITFLERSKSDISLLAIGSPQSELLAAQVSRRGRARGVALCIGASVEFVTGEKRRAPYWMSRVGLEWLFRLITEPRRLWRRYLVEGPAILSIWMDWRKSRPMGPH